MVCRKQNIDTFLGTLSQNVLASTPHPCESSKMLWTSYVLQNISCPPIFTPHNYHNNLHEHVLHDIVDVVHLILPNLCIFQWEAGDFIISDNLAVAHLASPSTQTSKEEVGLRVMHRTIVKGMHRPDKDEEYYLKKHRAQCCVILWNIGVHSIWGVSVMLTAFTVTSYFDPCQFN